MVHDVNKNETTHADTARTVSHGVKSLIVLGLLGSVSAVLGVVSIGPDSESGGISAAHASPVPPPLAATLLSATEFEPVLGAPTQTSDTLKRRETLTELVTRLGAEPSDAAAALHTIYEKEFLDPRRLRPGVKADAFLTNGKLTALNIKADAERNLFITRTATGDWTASELKARLSPTYHRVAAPIETSIYDARTFYRGCLKQSKY